MDSDLQDFRGNFIRLLVDSAESMFKARESWMEEEIHNGWRCFFAQELWMKENLPAPHINEAGISYEIFKIKRRLLSNVKGNGNSFDFAGNVDDYRNYLDPGAIDFCEVDMKRGPSDNVANSTLINLLASENRHFWFEILKLQQEWRNEISFKAEFGFGEPANMLDGFSNSMRDERILLGRDSAYWSAVYGLAQFSPAWDIAIGADNFLRSIMQNITSDFIYLPLINHRTQLVFAKLDARPLNWVIIFDRIGYAEQGQVDYLPKLALVNSNCLSSKNKKNSSITLKEKDILFIDPMRLNILPIYDATHLELHLRYILERYGRAIYLYDQFIGSVLEH